MKIGSRVLDLWFAGSILESKGICAIFQKKGKKAQKKCQKRAKKGETFENLGKNVQNRQLIPYDHYMP